MQRKRSNSGKSRLFPQSKGLIVPIRNKSVWRADASGFECAIRARFARVRAMARGPTANEIAGPGVVVGHGNRVAQLGETDAEGMLREPRTRRGSDLRRRGAHFSLPVRRSEIAAVARWISRAFIASGFQIETGRLRALA